MSFLFRRGANNPWKQGLSYDAAHGVIVGEPVWLTFLDIPVERKYNGFMNSEYFTKN